LEGRASGDLRDLQIQPGATPYSGPAAWREFARRSPTKM